MKATGSPKSFIPLLAASALGLMFHVMVIFHVNIFSCVLCKCVATSTTGLFSSWIAELLHQKHKNVLTTQQPTTQHAKEPQSPWFIVGRLLLITRSWLTHWNKAIAYFKQFQVIVLKNADPCHKQGQVAKTKRKLLQLRVNLKSYCRTSQKANNLLKSTFKH